MPIVHSIEMFDIGGSLIFCMACDEETGVWEIKFDNLFIKVDDLEDENVQSA